jgi:hypothetical protein
MIKLVGVIFIFRKKKKIRINDDRTIHEFIIGSVPDLPPLEKRNDYFSNNNKRIKRILEPLGLWPKK